jgi:putative phosphoesterase
MRIAFISDIHGNVFALDSVLEDLESERVDQIICLGDLAFGPQPHEAIERMKALGCPIILGNWDSWSLKGMPHADDEIGRRLMEIGEFWANLLTDEDREFIGTFKPTLPLELDDGTTILCFHGSPNSFEDFVFATTSDDDLKRMFDGYKADVLVGGHTHLQMVRRWEDSVIINPGSVGQPFRNWWPRIIRNAHWAEYGLLDVDKGRMAIDVRRTTYDVEALLRIFRESGMPHAEWWIESWSAAEPGEITTLDSPTRPPPPREPGRKRSRATTT